MATQNISYPKDSIVIVQALSTVTGGVTLDLGTRPNKTIEAGTIVRKSGGTHEILEACKAQAAALTGDNVLQVYKGHTLKIGSAIKAATVTAIDQSNEAYDTVTCSGTFGAGIALNEGIVNGGAEAIGVVVTSKVADEFNKVDVGVMYRGEVNEAALTNPINAAVKTALPLIKFVTD